DQRCSQDIEQNRGIHEDIRRTRCRYPNGSSRCEFEPMSADEPIRRSLRVTAADGASAALELLLPANTQAREAVLFLPALGVGVNPNLRFAAAMAERGIATAVLEWRGLGSSSHRAGRRCDWDYRHILDLDIPAAINAATQAVPDARWSIGGHSIGGQFALLTAAQM